MLSLIWKGTWFIIFFQNLLLLPDLKTWSWSLCQCNNKAALVLSVLGLALQTTNNGFSFFFFFLKISWVWNYTHTLQLWSSDQLGSLNLKLWREPSLAELNCALARYPRWFCTKPVCTWTFPSGFLRDASLNQTEGHTEREKEMPPSAELSH